MYVSVGLPICLPVYALCPYTVGVIKISTCPKCCVPGVPRASSPPPPIAPHASLWVRVGGVASRATNTPLGRGSKSRITTSPPPPFTLPHHSFHTRCLNEWGGVQPRCLFGSTLYLLSSSLCLVLLGITFLLPFLTHTHIHRCLSSPHPSRVMRKAVVVYGGRLGMKRARTMAFCDISSPPPPIFLHSPYPSHGQSLLQDRSHYTVARTQGAGASGRDFGAVGPHG